MRTISLFGYDFETIYSVFIAHDVLKNGWSIFFNPEISQILEFANDLCNLPWELIGNFDAGF